MIIFIYITLLDEPIVKVKIEITDLSTNNSFLIILRLTYIIEVGRSVINNFND